MKKPKKIGILTAGGDCPGLNPVIRALVLTLLAEDVEIVGIKNGFKGLINCDFMPLDEKAVERILALGGTILGSDNRTNPFEYTIIEDGKKIKTDMTQVIIENLKRHEIEVLVCTGGDGTLTVAGKLSEAGVKIVAVPKTIDNDIPGTERTFGFDTAVAIATEALERLHTTAWSHHRIMVCEVMGRTAGWIALHAGIAGGADTILLPEIPYKLEAIVAQIERSRAKGQLYTIICVSEGAHQLGGEVSVARTVEGSAEAKRLGGIANILAAQLEELTGEEARACILGHTQRGGEPTPFDRILSTRYGAEAGRCVLDGDFDQMVALKQNKVVRLPISFVAGKTRTVPVDDELVFDARSIGVCFGDC